MDNQKLTLKNLARRMSTYFSNRDLVSCMHDVNLRTWRCSSCNRLTWVMKPASC